MLRIHTIKDGALLRQQGVAALRVPEKDERAWIDVVEPSEEERRALVDGFGIHELAIEDVLRAGHPPKLEDFAEHLFLIVHTPDADEEEGTRKLAVFLSKAWVITVLRKPLKRMEEVARRVDRDPERYLESPARLAHACLDHLTDGFEQHVDELMDRLERIENQTQQDPQPGILAAILEMRHEVSAMTRTVRGQRDTCLSLVRSTHPALPKRLEPYFRDVYDHVLRVYDLLESTREGLGAARDAYLSAVNTRLSEIMRVLTVIATIMMPLGVVAGIYGMNFQSMPGSESPAGFWVTVGVMLVLAAGMLAWFRRRGWL